VNKKRLRIKAPLFIACNLDTRHSGFFATLHPYHSAPSDCAKIPGPDSMPLEERSATCAVPANVF